MKIGLEVEFFGVGPDKKVVDCSQYGLPTDEYPLLAEARGLPHTCAYQAVYSVKAEIARIIAMMGNRSSLTPISPLFANWIERDDHFWKLHYAILRRGLNKRINFENISGLEPTAKSRTHLSAGLHVSFTPNPKTIKDKDGRDHTFYEVYDFSKIIKRFDKEFGEDVKRAERVPGFYEIKPDGRIEYRSLPATIINDSNFIARLQRTV